MRILYWQQNPVFGACETYLELAASGVAVARPDWEIALAAPTRTVREWRKRLDSHIGVLSYDPGFRGAARLLRLFRPDLIHVNDPALHALSASRLTRTPCRVVTWHTPSLPIEWNLYGRLLALWGIRSASLTPIVLSETNAVTLAARYGVHGAVVIPPGMESSRFDGPAQARAEWLSNRVPDSTFRLVSVGRLNPQKGYDLLLRALAKANESVTAVSNGAYRRMTLSIAGDGASRVDLICLAHDLGVEELVDLAGWQDSPSAFIERADLFVLSSRFEGLPFALLEAMAVGLPVLATSVDGIRDVVTPEFGWLVAANDIDSLALGLLGSVSVAKQLPMMGAVARLRFLESFTAERMIDDLISLYRRLPQFRT